MLDTSLGLTTGASPAASWWLLQSQNQGSCNDNFETTLRQPDGLHSTEAGPRSGAVPRLGRRPAGCGSRPQRSGGEDGQEEHASTLHHFVALCDNVWHFVTLCNTLVTLVHRLCCTHGRVANSWPSSTSTTSGWPGSTGLPGRTGSSRAARIGTLMSGFNSRMAHGDTLLSFSGDKMSLRYMGMS